MPKKSDGVVTTVWNYLKPSWEGDDGKVSYRRASQFVFIVLIAFMVFSRHAETQYGHYTLLALLITFLLLAAVVTADQIIKGVYGLKSFTTSVVQEEEIVVDEEGKKTATTTTEVTHKADTEVPE